MLFPCQKVSVKPHIVHIILQSVRLAFSVFLLNFLHLFLYTEILSCTDGIHICLDSVLGKRVSHVILVSTQSLDVVCVIDNIRNVVNVLVESPQSVIIRMLALSFQKVSAPFLPRAKSLRSARNVHRQLLCGKIKAQLSCRNLHQIFGVVKAHVREIALNVPNRIISVPN